MYIKDVPIKLFRDKEQKYKPYNLYLGSKKISGWKYKEISGESVIVSDTYNDNAYVKINGKSEQVVTVQGKNLWRNTTLPKTEFGVTFTYDSENDEYILDGTATVTDNVYIIPSDKNLFAVSKNAKISVSAWRLSGTNSKTFYPYIRSADAITIDVSLEMLSSTTNNTTFGIPKENSICTQMYFFILKGTVFDNLRVKVQVEFGTATAWERFMPNSPTNDYRQVINSTSNFDLIIAEGTNEQIINFSGTYRDLPNGVCDKIIIDDVEKTATYQPYIKKATLSSGSSWNLADAKSNSAFRCSAIKPSTLNGTTLESTEAITSSFDVQYELAILPEPTELDYEAVKTYFNHTNFSTNATVQPTLEVKLKINE